MRTLTLLAFVLAGCAGDIGNRCKPDGTCNNPRLECRPFFTFVETGEWICKSKESAP